MPPGVFFLITKRNTWHASVIRPCIQGHAKDTGTVSTF